MSFGSGVRSLFGPLEPAIARIYRGIFIDIGAFADTLSSWVTPTRILEVGCGEGHLTEELSRVFPSASITGIDISPRLGRLFGGNRSRVTFRNIPVEQLVAENPAAFDLVIICDVLHHVPVPARAAFLANCAACVAHGGAFVLKDWKRTRTLIYGLCYFSDRFISQDQVVTYETAEDLRERFGLAFEPVSREAYVPPWRSNILLFGIRTKMPTSLPR